MGADLRVRAYYFWAGLAALIFSVGLFLSSYRSLKATQLGAVLPLNAETGDVAFYSVILRDPEIVQHKPEDEEDALRLAQEIKEFRSDLTRAKGARALELHEQAYEGYAALSYYLEDVVQGSMRGDRAKAQQNLGPVRGFLAQHALSAASLSSNSGQKAKAQYHAFIANFLTGNDPSLALQKLKSLASQGGLSNSLKKPIEFLIAFNGTDSERDRLKAAKTLESLAPGLSTPGAVAARIAAARVYAGISRDGRKIAATQSSYRSQLAAAASASSRLPEGQRTLALSRLIGVWRKADPAGSWQSVPFNLASFADSEQVFALVERSAMEDWQKGQLSKAIKKYRTLAGKLEGNPSRRGIDLRILDLRRVEYAKSRDPKPYAAELASMQKAYLDPGILGAGKDQDFKAMVSEIKNRHASLVENELARVTRDKVSKAERLSAIALAQGFLQSTDDQRLITAVKEKVGQAYSLNGQHREAVGVYRELVSLGSNPKRYLGLAIVSQSILASWSHEPPWNGFSSGDQTARQELLELYNQYSTSAGGDGGWLVAGQRGLLMSSLGQVEKAFELWRLRLKKDPQGGHAAQASGFMLSAYHKAKDWSQLEDLARQCLTAGISPIYRGSAISARDSLGLALIEGGNQALSENQFSMAVKKLQEFVGKYTSHQRHDEGMLKLAHAQRGNQQHKDSIITLTSFVEIHQRSKYLRDALLLGGDWSAPMAFEENAMFFYERFLEKFGSDPESERVRTASTALFLGKGLYDRASKVLTAKAKSQRASTEEKSEALLTLLDIEDRHGEVSRAEKAADEILRTSGSNAEQKAEALGLKAELALKKGDANRLKVIESELSKLSRSSGVDEVVGRVRYFQAGLKGANVVKEYFNLELSNPTQTLVERYSAWKQVQSAYDAVCEVQSSSACAPAMHDLSKLAVEFLRSIEDIEIQDTLAKGVVKQFKSRKQAIYNEVAKVAQRADDRALAAVRKGESEPDTAQAVLWQNTSDWNFERVSGASGNAFVQWAVPSEAE